MAKNPSVHTDSLFEISQNQPEIISNFVTAFQQ